MRPADFAPLPELLTFTVDVEPNPGPASDLARTERMTHRLLDFLDERGARGTFFVVGDLALLLPALVREIGRRGHEVGCHGHRHLPLGDCDRTSLGPDLARARLRLQDLAEAPVLGFRAPLFSLTPATAWALPLIAEAGFAYSSSVLPARSFAHGWPGLPPAPFSWPGGLVELPCPLGRLGPLRLPCLGGMYLRHLPSWRIRQLSRHLTTPFVWTYCHPYDVDVEEPLAPMLRRQGTAGFFLWWRRGVMLDRLAALMEGRRSMSFAERLGGLEPQILPAAA